MEKKITNEVLKLFLDESATDIRAYMNHPISVDYFDIYALSSTICLRCKLNDCIDIQNVKTIGETFEEPEKKLTNFNTMFEKTAMTQSVVVNVQKLSELLDSMRTISETEWVGEEEECPECTGSGNIEVEYDAVSDGKTYYIEAVCPICHGTGVIGDRHEVVTGRQIVPYWADVDFGFPFNIRASLLKKVIALMNCIEVKNFVIERTEKSKFVIDVDNIRIIVAGCTGSAYSLEQDDTYKYC